MVRIKIGDHEYFVEKESDSFENEDKEYWFINLFRGHTKEDARKNQVETILHSEKGEEPSKEVMISVGRAFASGYGKGKRKGDVLEFRLEKLLSRWREEIS